MAEPWEMNWGQPQAPARPGFIPGTGKTPPAQTPDQAESVRLANIQKQIEIDKARAEAAAGESAKLTEGERNAAAFLRRALGAELEYTAAGVGPRSLIGQTINDISPNALNQLPASIGNSPERQQTDNRIKRFVAATLRKDTGAAFGAGELTTQNELYFPQAGETSPEIIAEKAKARREAIEGLITSSGRSIPPDLQAQVDQWRAGQQPDDPSGRAAGVDPTVLGADATNAKVYAPGTDQTTLMNGGEQQYRTENDPSLAGVDHKVNEMLMAGAKPADFVAFFQQVGIPPQQVMPSLMKAIAWRKQHPEYRGPHDASSLDDRRVPIGAVRSTIADYANSQVGAAAVEAGNIASGNHLDNLVNMTGGNGELANIGMEELRNRYPEGTFVGDLAGGASIYGAGRGVASKLGMKAATELGAFAPRAIVGDAALGGYIGSGSEGTEPFSISGTLKGAGLSAGGGIAGRGTINTLGSLISPTGGKLAPLYEAGVKPSIGQRMGASDNWFAKAGNRMEQAFASVPLLGGIQRGSRNTAVAEGERGGFNQALGEIDTHLPDGIVNGHEAHAFMQDAFNQVYDKARSGMTFAPDGQFATDFGNVLNDVNLLDEGSAKTFEKVAREIGIRIRKNGGTLTGDDYKLVSERIGKKIAAIRNNPNGDRELADALDNFSLAIDDAAKRKSPPEFSELMDKADKGYAKAVVLETASGAEGRFSGARLDNAVKKTSGGVRNRRYLRGQALMQDYGEAMRALGDDLPNSGTWDRAAAVGGVGVATAKAPAVLAPYVANTVANMPGVRSVVNAVVAPNRKALRPAADAIRRRAYLGGLFGVPLVEGNQ